MCSYLIKFFAKYFADVFTYNGVSKPNIMGKDLFLFTYDAEKRSLLPMGHPDSMYPYDTNCVAKNGTGYGCAYYVLKFKDMKYLK